MKYDTYELIISPNWGISRCNVIYCKSKEELLQKYDDTKLGGAGNVYDVIARINGKVIKSKHYKGE